jgi:hypothetical protein
MGKCRSCEEHETLTRQRKDEGRDKKERLYLVKVIPFIVTEKPEDVGPLYTDW